MSTALFVLTFWTAYKKRLEIGWEVSREVGCVVRGAT